MQTIKLSPGFFQQLAELESHIRAAEGIAILVTQSADNHAAQHVEKNSLQVHLHYMRDSIKELEKIRLRFNLLRHYFVPEIGQPDRRNTRPKPKPEDPDPWIETL